MTTHQPDTLFPFTWTEPPDSNILAHTLTLEWPVRKPFHRRTQNRHRRPNGQPAPRTA